LATGFGHFQVTAVSNFAGSGTVSRFPGWRRFQVRFQVGAISKSFPSTPAFPFPIIGNGKCRSEI
jgi:hypothetical protein